MIAIIGIPNDYNQTYFSFSQKNGIPNENSRKKKSIVIYLF